MKLKYFFKDKIKFMFKFLFQELEDELSEVQFEIEQIGVSENEKYACLKKLTYFLKKFNQK